MPHQRSEKKLIERQNEFLEKYGVSPTKPKRYEGFYNLVGTQIRQADSDPSRLTKQLKDTFRHGSNGCVLCGWNEYPEALVIHHIDKNTRNNLRSNLLVLCRNCHFLVHQELKAV